MISLILLLAAAYGCCRLTARRDGLVVQATAGGACLTVLPGGGFPSPIVLGLHPRRGWADADEVQRRRAGSVPLLCALWVLLGLSCRVMGPGWAVASGLLVCVTAWALGPAAFCALARVLRPQPWADREREARHAVAGASMALFTAGALSLLGGGGAFVLYLLGLPSLLGLVVTLPWGVVAALVRAGQHR